MGLYDGWLVGFAVLLDEGRLAGGATVEAGLVTSL